jgi:hypothetical protein
MRLFLKLSQSDLGQNQALPVDLFKKLEQIGLVMLQLRCRFVLA